MMFAETGTLHLPEWTSETERAVVTGPCASIAEIDG